MSQYVWGDNETQFFFNLNPDLVLNTIDSLGYNTTGRCLTLNSMENRVYEVEIDRPDYEIKSPSDNFVIAKFYRPGRWTKKQILEEHQFLLELQEAEIPVIAPIKLEGKTLFDVPGHDIGYTLFPKKGGRAPDEMNEEQLEIMGRLLARIHNVGSTNSANHRIEITPDSFGIKNLSFILKNNFIPPHLESTFKNLVEEICNLITPMFDGIPTHRIHGDCHSGNIITRDDEGPFFIDFDDMLVGPAVQDIWLVIPGDDQYAKRDRSILLESYETMRDFDYRQLKLIEPLRTLRYIHFAAWIAGRWDDPSFKNAFPQFGEDYYWENLINDLRHQLVKINNVIDSTKYQ